MSPSLAAMRISPCDEISSSGSGCGRSSVVVFSAAAKRCFADPLVVVVRVGPVLERAVEVVGEHAHDVLGDDRVAPGPSG